jgi:hypothetical protein
MDFLNGARNHPAQMIKDEINGNPTLRVFAGLSNAMQASASVPSVRRPVNSKLLNGGTDEQ